MCTLYMYVLFYEQCVVYNVRCTLYNVHCTVYIIHCKESVHCTMSTFFSEFTFTSSDHVYNSLHKTEINLTYYSVRV